jgi:hypothetical protein
MKQIISIILLFSTALFATAQNPYAVEAKSKEGNKIEKPLSVEEICR